MEQVARSDATVLIQGEHGSGKNLSARRLHEQSPRRAGPLINVSLVALAPTLVEAELFGHEAGAFTGALSARLGRFRQAQRGTLVLDDVDALPSELQGKLLRVLQERVVEPLGSETTHPIDVRVVCTTSRDLREAVEAGEFRSDLYWRLAVVPLEVPPLRVRLDELPELAAELVARISTNHGVLARSLSEAALARLRVHAWPGNVRELENALERVLVLAPPDAGAIQASEFDFLGSGACGVADELAERALARGLRLEDFERALLERALVQHAGNLSAAARRYSKARRVSPMWRARFQTGAEGESSS